MIKAKGIHIVFFVTGIILLIPLVAMQLTSEVNWGVMDFVIAAVLLMSTGFAINYAQKKLMSSKYRILIIASIIVLLLLVWAELAVGVFGTPFAGS